jgi:UDP-glucose 4-epimerase
MCDVTLEALHTYAREPALVVHCAGSASVAFSMAEPLLDYRRTVESTVATLEYLRQRARSAAFVFPSSGSVYGSHERGTAPESAPTDPQSAYAVHKLLAERLCASYGRFFGIRSTIIRFFSVYGAGLRKQLLWDACTRLSRGETTFAGTGDETRDWLHVDDAASLVLAGGQRATAAGTIVNGGTGVGVAVRDVVTALCGELNPEQRISFSGERRAGDPHRFVADTTVARSWGWAPRISWRDGVREYATWFASGAP